MYAFQFDGDNVMRRLVIGRLAVSVVLLAAAFILKSATAEASHFGACYYQEWRCSFNIGNITYCFDVDTCPSA